MAWLKIDDGPCLIRQVICSIGDKGRLIKVGSVKIHFGLIYTVAEEESGRFTIEGNYFTSVGLESLHVASRTESSFPEELFASLASEEIPTVVTLVATATSLYIVKYVLGCIQYTSFLVLALGLTRVLTLPVFSSCGIYSVECF